VTIKDPLPVTYEEEACTEFDWSEAWDFYEGTRDSFNLGSEIIGNADDTETTAVRIVDMNDGSEEVISVADLATRSQQVANFLDNCGLERDRVAAVMEPREALYATIAGTWLGGYVYVPLYTLFGPRALHYRLENSRNEGRRDDVRAPGQDRRVRVGRPRASCNRRRADRGRDAVFRHSGVRASYEPAETSADDLCALQYTSGTTGDPKGVEYPHGSPVALYPYTKYAVDLRSDDTSRHGPTGVVVRPVQCTVVPLKVGAELVTIRGDLDPGVIVDIVTDDPITSFFAPPTVFRQMAQLDIEVDTDSIDLRRIYSAGESIGSGTVEWVEETFGRKVPDHYGFTEGGMLVNNYPLEGWEIKPGAMGKPLPGLEVSLLDLEADKPVDTGEVGEISVRPTDEVSFAESYFKMPEKARRSSAATGFGPTILLDETKTGTSGTWAGPTTLSSPPAIESDPRRSRTAC